jgi:hypothetical protein
MDPTPYVKVRRYRYEMCPLRDIIKGQTVNICGADHVVTHKVLLSGWTENSVWESIELIVDNKVFRFDCDEKIKIKVYK